MTGNEEAPSTEPALLGILALLAADRAEREPEPALPTELVLAAAGVPYQLIAEILGKKPDAVRMKISRAKEGTKPKAKASGGKGTKVRGGKK